MRNWLIILAFFTMSFGVSAQGASLPTPRFVGFHDVHAYVTGYNTVPGQTDDTPCIAASGANICGRTDAVACPRRITLGTYLAIRGAFYVCEDRLAKKYDSRFDISCDKDTNCPGQVTGWTEITIFNEDLCKVPANAPRTLAAALRPLRTEVATARPLRTIAATAHPVRTIAAAAHPIRMLRGRLRESRRA